MRLVKTVAGLNNYLLIKFKSIIHMSIGVYLVHRPIHYAKNILKMGTTQHAIDTFNL